MTSRPAVGLARITTLLLVLAGCGVQESQPLSTTTPPGDQTVTDTGQLPGIKKLSGSLIVHPGGGVMTIELPDLTDIEGSVLIEGAVPDGFVLSLPAVTSIGLDVSVSGTGSAVTLSMPLLTGIAGHLIFDHTAPVTVHALALRTIHGDLRATDAALGTLDLPALQQIGGSLILMRYQGVGNLPFSLSLPSLATIVGSLQVSSSAAVTTLNLPVLTNAAGLVAISADVQLQLPSLATLSGSFIAQDTVLVASQLGALAEVDGDLSLISDSLQGTDGLSLPALVHVTGSITIDRVFSLVTIDLPSLAEVDTGIRITSDGQLQRATFAGMNRLQADFLLSGCGGPVVLSMPALIQADGSVLITGNGTVSVSTPLLVGVTGSIHVTGGIVLALSMPALASVAQDLVVESITAMPSQPLSFTSLNAVGGDLRFDKTGGFSVLAVPELVSVGGSPGGFARGTLLIQADADLTSVDVTALRTVVVAIEVSDNAMLTGAEAAFLLVKSGTSTICGNADDLACAAPAGNQ